MKPTKDLIINEILQEIDFATERTAILSAVVEKWRVSSRTFDRYWKEANLKYQAANQRDAEVLDKVRVEMKVEALKTHIMGKIERMEILSQIARGEIPLQKPMVVSLGSGLGSEIQETEIVPTWLDRKLAIAELNKMDGEYAPIKKDITTGGEQLPAPVFNIILDDGEL